MIECSNIIKSYSNITALNGISLSANKGEIFGVVGPDGAGKSTLMKILATTLEPDSGNLFINGIAAADDLFNARENIAYMPQKFGLYEDLTVEENIYFFGHLFGINNSEIRKRLFRLYEFSRLEKFSNRLAGNLSGGMKQKLGLVCALVHTPKVLILDEPTNGVDPVSRREFWMILYELLAEGVAIIVSTAYLDEAERCSRLALIDKGKFVAVDEPLAIKKSVVKDFIKISSHDPLRAENALIDKFPDLNVNRTGNILSMFIGEKGKGVSAVRTVLAKKKIICEKIVAADPSLENCFTEIIGAHHRSIK